MSSVKERVKATEGRYGVRGPSTYARIAEIKLGRTNIQQRLMVTCKDLSK